MKRYVCIHGHFYQPPRENSWLEFVEVQDSAYPYHDWNERITDECYATNTAARILDGQNRIVQIVNNYAKISFNFGPTLLAWLEANATETYQSILRADKESQKRFSGHGSALAQTYNHMIMPLANRRDKYTQALWGLRDFRRRFGWDPEGMWLPETAVDLETLVVLSELGIRFTILAPHQARQVRPLDSDKWQDVRGGRIDTTMPYLVRLPNGKTMSLFFYNGPLSRAVAFEGLLANGEQFAQRLVGAFSESLGRPQLVHIATDGETYGHHHRFGEMALAYALHYIESKGLARITNYGEYLEKHPPTHEVEIIEDTSWSCAHGIARWRSNCGCATGGHEGWSQEWRRPLREALDWLRDTLAPLYEVQAAQLLKDPWRARNDYIEVILDRSPERVSAFLSRHMARPLQSEEKIRALKLLELQRHAMLMYTSCGWFFDELSRIETVQVIQYAGRVVQLAEELFGEPVEDRFLEILEKAESNIPEHRNGRRVYEKFVKPAMLDLTKVGAHYAISSLFEEYPEETRIYCYLASRENYQAWQIGKTRLAVGRTRIANGVTNESALLSFGVLHFGDHNLNAGVRPYQDTGAYQEMLQELSQTFSRADYPAVIRLLDKHFGSATYSLRDLFHDEQRKVLGYVLESTLAAVEAQYRQLYGNYVPLMRFITDIGTPQPRAFQAIGEFIINMDLTRALSDATLSPERVRGLLEEAGLWNVELDAAGLAHTYKRTLEQRMNRLVASLEDTALLKDMVESVKLVRDLPFPVSLWRPQNQYCAVLFSPDYRRYRERARQGIEKATEWVNQFTSLGQQLGVRVE